MRNHEMIRLETKLKNIEMKGAVKMKRNRKQFLRKMAAVIFAAIICLGGISPALAAGSPIMGTEGNPADAAVTKVLRMPAGVTTPGAGFTFTFAKKNVDGSTAAGDLAAMPAIANKTVSFTSADEGITAGGVKLVAKETSNLFAGVVWPHAGIFIYTVTETADTYTIADPTKEQMTYSGASYDIAVYVEEGAGGLFVSAIAAVITVKDASNEGGDVGDKVDPTPRGLPEVEGDYSKMIFTNTYLKNNGGENPTDSVLDLSKTVTGSFGNKTKYFLFDVTVSNPSTIMDTGKTYRAYVLDENDTVVTDTNNADITDIKTDPVHGAYIEFTTNEAKAIHLKHGQRLAFIDLPVGAKYSVTESAAVGYSPSYTITADGSGIAAAAGNENENLGFADEYVRENENSISFTNTCREVTPTGVSIDNLPYIVIVLLGTLAFIGLTVFKLRKYKKNGTDKAEK